MPIPRFPVASVIALLLTVPQTPGAEPAAVAAPAAGRPAVSVVDLVLPQYKAAVAEVVKAPTLSAQASEDPFTAHARVYDWLLDHPDRASVAWRRMNVPCVEIDALGDGRFRWADGKGGELVWRAVGRYADGVVWYATGKVNPGALLPTIPVKAVAVLRAPRAPVANTDGKAVLEPTLSVYLLTDNRAAQAVLRVVGPAAPRMAEQGADQLLLFFSGPARHVHRHPDQAESLLAPKSK
ncbi:MAG: hypothetical protein U0871_17495 [Gemmataceae bacterium]